MANLLSLQYLWRSARVIIYGLFFLLLIIMFVTVGKQDVSVQAQDSVPLVAVDDGNHDGESEVPTYGKSPYPLPPVAIDDNYVITQTMVLSVTAPGGVLRNDHTPIPLPLTAVLVAVPSHGDLTLNLNGSFHYTPTVDFSGLDTFFYHAFDGALFSNVATGTIQVNPLFRPGDCNADQQVDAGDLAAVLLELFDGDGAARVDAGGGSFPGSPTCDANENLSIDAADLSCTVLLIFQGAGACEE